MMKHTQICCGNGLSRISSRESHMNIVKHFSLSPPLTVCTSEFCLYTKKNRHAHTVQCEKRIKKYI